MAAYGNISLNYVLVFIITFFIGIFVQGGFNGLLADDGKGIRNRGQDHGDWLGDGSRAFRSHCGTRAFRCIIGHGVIRGHLVHPFLHSAADLRDFRLHGAFPEPGEGTIRAMKPVLLFSFASRRNRKMDASGSTHARAAGT